MTDFWLVLEAMGKPLRRGGSWQHPSPAERHNKGASISL